MLKVSRILIAGLAVIAAPGLHAECAYPEDIVIAEGASSTYEEMNDGQSLVKEYMAEMEAYLKCLEPEQSVLASQLTDDSAARRKQNRRQAMDAMEAVAAKFNEQVRAFKKANP